MERSHNASSYVDIQASFSLDYYNESGIASLLDCNPDTAPSSNVWVFDLVILILTSMLLSKHLGLDWTSRPASTSQNTGTPPQLPYLVPVIGNLASYLISAAQLASSIT